MLYLKGGYAWYDKMMPNRWFSKMKTGNEDKMKINTYLIENSIKDTI